MTALRRHRDEGPVTMLVMSIGTGVSSTVADDRAAIERWLTDQLADLLGAARVESELIADPSDATPDGRIDLVVTDIGPIEDQRTDRDLPARVHLTYLVAPAHAEPARAAEWLAHVVLRARGQALFELLDDRPSDEWWIAMGCVPRPCLRIRTMLVVAPPAGDRAPIVRMPLRIRLGGSAPLSGTIIAGGDPIPAAVVRLTSTGQRSTTDRRGRFVFPNVSVDGALGVRVEFRGTSYDGIVPAEARGELLVDCTPEAR